MRLDRRVKVVYDLKVDVPSDAPIAESDQEKRGSTVSFEILDASKRIANPMSFEYAATPPAGLMVLPAHFLFMEAIKLRLDVSATSAKSF